MRALRQSGAAVALTAVMVAPAAAFAQAADVPPPPAEAEASGAQAGGGIEDIVVTAQKRTENLQDVPIAVSAIDGGAIERLHVNNLADVTGSIPNLIVAPIPNNTLTASYAIRGVGITEGDPFAGSSVAVVVDGVIQTTPTIGLVDLFDVERVEVLRGPQGTLFGANTTGGVINIVTRQPTGDFGVEGRVTIGNFDRIEGAAAINFPLLDGLSGKVSILHKSRSGYYRNLVDPAGSSVGDQDLTLIRGYLRYENGNVDATLVVGYDRGRNGADPIVNLSIPGNVFYRPSPTTGIRYETASQVPDVFRFDQYMATLTVNLDIGDVDLTSITGYSEYTNLRWTDYDGLPEFLLHGPRDAAANQFSQELRATVRPADGVEVLLGAFYLDKWYDVVLDSLLQGVTPGLRSRGTQSQDSRAISGFAQAYFSLTDTLQLQVGARVTYEQTDARAGVTQYIHPSGIAQLTGDDMISDVQASGSEDWTQFGGRIGLNYQPTDDITMYAYYARGFKSGGFNGRINVPEAIGPFGPETVDTIEVGFKSDWFDRRLRVNIAAFQNWYDDKQVPQIRFIGSIAASTIENAASVVTRGVEAEVVAVPIENFRITGTLGYLHARFEEFVTGGVDYSGRRIPRAPDWTASLGANYNTPLAGGELTVSALYSWKSEELSNFTALPIERLPAAGLLSASIGWGPESGDWSVSLWSRNLTNERYIVNALATPPLFQYGSYSIPREVGIDFNFRF